METRLEEGRVGSRTGSSEKGRSSERVWWGWGAAAAMRQIRMTQSPRLECA